MTGNQSCIPSPNADNPRYLTSATGCLPGIGLGADLRALARSLQKRDRPAALPLVTAFSGLGHVAFFI